MGTLEGEVDRKTPRRLAHKAPHIEGDRQEGTSGHPRTLLMHGFGMPGSQAPQSSALQHVAHLGARSMQDCGGRQCQSIEEGSGGEVSAPPCCAPSAWCPRGAGPALPAAPAPEEPPLWTSLNIASPQAMVMLLTCHIQHHAYA